MALIADLKLAHTGLEQTIPVYASLQNVTAIQKRDLRTGRVFWSAKASVYCYASREAKYKGMEPVTVTSIETEFDPAKDGDILTLLYSVAKTMPALVNAKDG